MTLKVDTYFENWYDSEVKRQNTSFSKLKDTVYQKSEIIGKYAYFRLLGDGMATEHIPGSPVTFMNPDTKQVSCMLKPYEAYDCIDEPEKKTYNFDLAKELAQIASMACSRRSDQLIIDALSKSTKDKIGNDTTKFTVSLLTAIQEKFDDASVPEEDRYILWTANQRSQLLQETKVTSSDYVNVKALVDGKIDQFLGFKFILIPSRKEGGLPRTSTSNMGFAYQKRHVGYANQQDITSSLNYRPELDALQVGAKFSAGATIIDEDGVVPFETKYVEVQA